MEKKEKKIDSSKSIYMTEEELRQYGWKADDKDKINPEWYKWLKDEIGVEAIDICELFTFNRGNAIKYLLRAGIKTEKGYSVPEKELEDLRKAKWYIEREIVQLEKMLDPMSHLDYSNVQTLAIADCWEQAKEYYKKKEEGEEKEGEEKEREEE